MLESIKKSWGWTGIQPNEIVSINNFGNIIFKDTQNVYWRICPEELYCKAIAQNDNELEQLFQNAPFKSDWNMNEATITATKKSGDLLDGESYCVKLPLVLGGLLEQENFGKIQLTELIRFSGAMAFEIKDLPNGQTIRFDLEE